MKPWEAYVPQEEEEKPWEAYAASASTSNEQDQNIVSRLKDVGVSRAQKAGEIAGSDANIASKTLQQIGNAAGLTSDAMGAGVVSAANLAPEFIKKPIGEAANAAFQAISNSPVGGFLANEGAKQAEFARRNPELAGNLEAVNNIAQLVPVSKIIKAGDKAVAPVAKAVGKGANAVAEATGNIVGKALPQIDEGLIDVATLARKYKIPLSFDQVSDSRALKNIQKVSQELPFSGQPAFRDKQMLSFNRALLKTVGQDADKFTPRVMDKAFADVGKEFDTLGAGKVFKLDDNFTRNLDEIRQEAGSIANKDAIANFENEVANVLKEAGPLGEIPGEKLGKLRAKINGLARKTSNYDTQVLLHDLENALIDTMTAGDDVVKGAFSTTKQKYKNLIAIEPLAAKAKGGNISPTQLNNRIARVYGRSFTRGQAGDIGDLARIGHEILPELGGSDTTQKLIYATGATGGVIANPALTAAVVGGNRLLQSGLNRNQRVIDKALMKKIMDLPPAEAKAALENLGK